MLVALRCVRGPFERRVEAEGPRLLLITVLEGSLVALSFPLGWLGQLSAGTNGVAGVICFSILTVVNCYLLGFVTDLLLRVVTRRH